MICFSRVRLLPEVCFYLCASTSECFGFLVSTFECYVYLMYVYYLTFACHVLVCVYFWVIGFYSVCLLPDIWFSSVFLLPGVFLYLCVSTFLFSFSSVCFLPNVCLRLCASISESCFVLLVLFFPSVSCIKCLLVLVCVFLWVFCFSTACLLILYLKWTLCFQPDVRVLWNLWITVLKKCKFYGRHGSETKIRLLATFIGLALLPQNLDPLVHFSQFAFTV